MNRPTLRRAAAVVAPPIVSLAIGGVAWHIAGRDIPVLLNTPGAAARSVIDMIKDGSLPSALLSSAILYIYGLIAAIVIGVGYGLLLARMKVLRESTEWLVFAAQAVPAVGLTPFILAGLGFGVGAKSFVVFLISVFPILINTLEGAHQTPRALLEVAKISRSSEWRLWCDLLVPHTIPYAMTGIRQGIATAFVGVIAAEFFLNASGIGGLLQEKAARFDSAAVLGITILLAAIAVALIALGRPIERIFSPWRAGASHDDV